ncbi:galactokinase [Marinimicrobium locisalis]|uniref:galactokinase n=1 Tax=Marinimicrobium locisalis TaxID=546022 RepID=UPI0032219EAE
MPHIDARLLAEQFEARYHRPPSVLAQAPGRVNLIGEHTDYNDGFVLPAAIDYVNAVAAAPRHDRQIQATALDIQGQSVRFSLDKPMENDPVSPWSDYLRGVVQALLADGYHLCGADLIIHGNVPSGAGLSSSAALEMALIRVLTALSEEPITSERAAQLGQRAENEFVGCNCGIMDQLVSAQGQVGKALLIDCRSLQTRAVPLPDDWSLLIVDSGVTRGLVESEYNLRREQCESAAAFFGARSLREVTLEQLKAAEGKLDPLLFHRAHHVLSENERTLLAADALGRADMATLATVMMESHRSMRDDFDISTPAIDTLVFLLARAARGQAGVRMTGGGFGGCVIALARTVDLPILQAAVETEYSARTGCRARLIPANASDGAFAPAGLAWLGSRE